MFVLDFLGRPAPPLPAYEKKETLMFVPLNQLQCSDSGDFQL
jgi:hypothetical protein